MKHLIIVATLVASASAFAADDVDFRSNKYIVGCAIAANINQPDLSNPTSGKSSNDVQFYIADKPEQKYTTDKNLVQRVYFRVDGGAALSLYQMCKEKLKSSDKRAALYAKPTADKGEYMGTWVTHTITNE